MSRDEPTPLRIRQLRGRTISFEERERPNSRQTRHVLGTGRAIDRTPRRRSIPGTETGNEPTIQNPGVHTQSEQESVEHIDLTLSDQTNISGNDTSAIETGNRNKSDHNQSGDRDNSGDQSQERIGQNLINNLREISQRLIEQIDSSQSNDSSLAIQQPEYQLGENRTEQLTVSAQQQTNEQIATIEDIPETNSPNQTPERQLLAHSQSANNTQNGIVVQNQSNTSTPLVNTQPETLQTPQNPVFGTSITAR